MVESVVHAAHRIQNGTKFVMSQEITLLRHSTQTTKVVTISIIFAFFLITVELWCLEHWWLVYHGYFELALRPDFTSNLLHGLAFGTQKICIAPYGKINHGLVNMSSNCGVKSGLRIHHKNNPMAADIFVFVIISGDCLFILIKMLCEHIRIASTRRF